MTPKLIARVSDPTQAIAHTGHGFELAAGDYPHVDIDGARDRGELFLRLPNGNLLCASADDPNITLHGVVATENLGSRIAVWLAATVSREAMFALGSVLTVASLVAVGFYTMRAKAC